MWRSFAKKKSSVKITLSLRNVTCGDRTQALPDRKDTSTEIEAPQRNSGMMIMPASRRRQVHKLTHLSASALPTGRTPEFWFLVWVTGLCDCARAHNKVQSTHQPHCSEA